MQEIEIRNCACCQPAERDEAKYQTNIIATACTWHQDLDVTHSLKTSPVAGQVYIVVLKQPVKFSMAMEMWLCYDTPLVSINGYVKEEEVEQTTFCYGQVHSVISQTNESATVAFDVKQTMTLQELLRKNVQQELPLFWTEHLLYGIDKDDFWVRRYGSYLELSVSLHDDIGLSCILAKMEDAYFICRVNHWSFSEEYTFGGKFLLPDEIKKRIVLDPSE